MKKTISYDLFKRIKAIIFLSLMITSFILTITPQKVEACGPIGLGLSPQCWGEDAGKGGAKEIREAIQYAIENGVEIRTESIAEFGFTEGTIQELIALTGIARSEAIALSNHFNEDIQATIDMALDKANESADIINELGKDFVSHGGTVFDSSIGKVFEELEAVTTDMNKLILSTSAEANALAKTAGLEARNTIRSAKTDLAALLDISTEKVDYLLGKSAREISTILAQASDEMAELIELTFEEAQDTIRIASEEAQKTLEKGFEEARETIDRGGVVMNSVIDNGINGLRITIKDLESGTIRATDNVSEETQEVIVTATENMKEVISLASDEVQEIVEVIKEARLQVINRGGEIVVYLVDRTADRILVLFAAFAGITFLFVASIGWGKAFLQWPLPDKYFVRVIVFTLMGMTFLSSFVPYWFLTPNVRAQVLLPMDQTETWAEKVSAPRIPDDPEVMRIEPDIILIQGTISGLDKYLRIYGVELNSENISAKFGSLDLPIPGQRNNFLLVNLSEVYQNPHSGDKVDIYINSSLLASVEVENRVDSEIFGDAKIKATLADSLRDSAKSSDDWQKIANLWEEARDLMQTVETYSQDYPVAQQKVGEYQANYEFAKQQVDKLKVAETKPQEAQPSQQSENTSRSVPEDRNSLTQARAVDIVNTWLSSKSKIFGPPFDRQLVENLTTGILNRETLEPNGSIDWLKKNNFYYSYETSRITDVWLFTPDSRRPSLKVRVYEDLTLHGPNGVDRSKSGAGSNNFIYYFSKDGNGTWKIEDYEKV